MPCRHVPLLKPQAETTTTTITTATTATITIGRRSLVSVDSTPSLLLFQSRRPLLAYRAVEISQLLWVAFKTLSGSHRREPVEDANPFQLASLSRVRCGPWAQSTMTNTPFILPLGRFYSKQTFHLIFRHSSRSFINARS